MTDILDEEANLAELRRQVRTVRMPRRTIAWQHQNIGASSRNITQRILITRKARSKLNSQIASSQNRIASLREAVLGK